MTTNNTDYLNSGELNIEWLRDILNIDDIRAFKVSQSVNTAVYRIEVNTVSTYCLKIIINSAHKNRHLTIENNKHPSTIYCESQGLIAIHNSLQQINSSNLLTPDVIYHDDNVLLSEWIHHHHSPTTKNQWYLTGQSLAKLHLIKVQHFGFAHNNYCGESIQINTPTNNGYDFFRDYRLSKQIELGKSAKLLPKSVLIQLDTVIELLEKLIPTQPPGLIHGDLWSGNVLMSESGNTVLIDPAAHYGWPEADLAMTCLFGGFPNDFYEGYLSINSLNADWQKRMPIYNLYHALNHVNIFGSSYISMLEETIRRIFSDFF